MIFDKHSIAGDCSWERLHEVQLLDEEWLRALLKSHIGGVQLASTHLLEGLVNSNYRLETDRGRYFLRLVTGEPEAAAKEVALLEEMIAIVPVPVTIAVAAYRERPVVLQEWIEGVTLKQALANASTNEAFLLGKSIGGVVARLNHKRFDAPGFLDGRGQVARRFSLNADGYLEFIDTALDRSAKLLSTELINLTWSWVLQRVYLMDQVSESARLVHGDFHTKNILVQRNEGHWQVNAVVDWESAMSWTPLFDLAILLRSPLPHWEYLQRGLLTGYLQEGSWIPWDWPKIRDLLQLYGWFDLLTKGETREQVIKSAETSIGRIVAGTS